MAFITSFVCGFCMYISMRNLSKHDILIFYFVNRTAPTPFSLL